MIAKDYTGEAESCPKPFLGVFIDSPLNFKYHIVYLTKKYL